ncbi:MAG: ABC transporter ATP-binding protein [Caldibacillus sp.]
MTETIIQLENLTKKYDDLYAVKNLSLSIKKGEIFGLLGPNGAGKTTTILMILGLSEPTSGKVTVCGIDSTRNPIGVKKRVGYLPDNVGFYGNMTGLENLVYTAELNGIYGEKAKKRAFELLERVDLLEAADKKTGTYSRGMRQRLGLADVLIKNPEVIILDEPTLGIDPEGVRDLLQLIKRLSEEEQITVLLSSHQLHQVQQICDRVGIFVKGKLLAEGDLDTLAKKLFIQDNYVIQVTVDEVTSELIKTIQSIPSVHKVERFDQRLEIYCGDDVSAEISKRIVQSGAALLRLNKKDFGLDEIYHRYFEGREER